MITRLMREDVLDAIEVISPEDTPAYNGLRKGKAHSTIHEWLEIALPSASAIGANSFAEGVGFTYASGGAYQPVETRRANRTQIFHKTWKVSGTVEGVGKYGRDSEWALRKLHAMKAWKVDVEVALLDNSASAAGSSGVVRTMNGMRAGDRITATANATSTLASPVDEGNLNVLLQAQWQQGVIIDRLICGAFVKRGISQFAGQGAGRPIFINNGERVFADVVDIYESDFGRIQLIASRRLNIRSEILTYQNNLMGLAFLRPPTARPTPNDGDFLTGAIVGELTFEYLNNGVFESKGSSKKLVNSGKAKALVNAMLILSQALAKGKVQRLDREVVSQKAETPVILRDGDIVHASMKIEGNMQRECFGRPFARPECLMV